MTGDNRVTSDRMIGSQVTMVPILFLSDTMKLQIILSPHKTSTLLAKPQIQTFAKPVGF